MNHIKSINTPRSWPFPRKQTVFSRANFVSNYGLENTIPLALLLRFNNRLFTSRVEENLFFRRTNIFVNGQRANPRTGVSLFNIIEIPSLNIRQMILLTSRRKFRLLDLPESFPQDQFVFRVLARRLISGDRCQVNLFGGVNLLVNRTDFMQFTRFSTVILNGRREILSIIPVQENSQVLVVSNSHCMEINTIRSIIQPTYPERQWYVSTHNNLNLRLNTLYFLPAEYIGLLQ